MKLLLLDRSDAARAGLVALLERTRTFQVEAAPDEAGALAAIQRQQPDLILLDLHHGDQDSAGVCSALRAASAAPLVVLVSFMTNERWAELKGAGADAYVLKRVDRRALERDLISIVENHRRHAGTTPIADGQN